MRRNRIGTKLKELWNCIYNNFIYIRGYGRHFIDEWTISSIRAYLRSNQLSINYYAKGADVQNIH